MIESSAEIGELCAALVQFQAHVTGAPKHGKNPHFKSKYTRLEDAWNAAREPLSAAGLAVLQWPSSDGDGKVSVCTRIVHKSGQWMSGTLTIELTHDRGGSKAQAYGSAITYACRYAFLAALGLPPEDDDAETDRAVAASRRPDSDRPPPPQQQAPRAQPTFRFGKLQGQPLVSGSLRDLDWYGKAVKASVSDPSKAQYRAANEAHLREVGDAYRAAKALEQSHEVEPIDDYDPEAEVING
jgi:hypothetical protein